MRLLRHKSPKQPNTRINGCSPWPPWNASPPSQPPSLPPERARCGPAAAPQGKRSRAGPLAGPRIRPRSSAVAARRAAPRTRCPRFPTYSAAGCSPAAPPSLATSLPPVRSREDSGAALPRLGASAAPVSACQCAGGRRRRPVSRGRGTGPRAASGSRGKAALPAGLRAGREGCREILAPWSAAWEAGRGGEKQPR